MSKRAVRTRLNWDAAYIFDSNDDDIHIISPHFTVFNHISPVNRSATGYDFSNSKKTIILKYMKNNDRLLQPERLDRIRSLLDEHKTMKVSELSRMCEVSENTIRRDLIELESEGFCLRSKGGATRASDHHKGSAFEKRHQLLREGKHAIAIQAAELVNSGDTIIIDSGTTAAELARKIAELRHITVITPSLAVANILSGIPEITLIMPGGVLNPLSGSLTGEPAEEFFRSIHADKLFLAVKAISVTGGLTDHNIAESSVKRSMIACSEHIIVLADHTKIGKSALSRIDDVQSAHTVVTDRGTDPLLIKDLERIGIEVLVG
jgi:DeoR/GlpR family transcriptional regulator of sugar metabolism